MAERDAEAFRALHQRTYGFVLDRARAILRVDAEAKDVAQEVYLEAWRSWSNVAEHPSPTGWLLAAATHRAIDRLRHRAHVERFARAARGDGVAPSAAEEVEVSMLLTGALKGESELCQRIVAHTLLDETTQEETATLLDVSRKTVQRHLERFRAKCAALIDDRRLRDV